MIAFFVVGTLVAGIGAWAPARDAAQQPPARALKGGDGDYAEVARLSWQLGVVLLMIGAALAWLPPLHGLPLFGYAAIATLLFGAVLLVPAVTMKVLDLAPRTQRIGGGHRRGATARKCRSFRPELGFHHRELQPDGGNGHHGVLVPPVIR